VTAHTTAAHLGHRL